MVLAIILTAIFTLSAQIAVLFYVNRRFTAGLRSYFAARGEHPSEFAELVGLILDQSAAKNAQSLKAVFMGQNSVASKNAGRVETAITQDLVSQQSPLLGMGMSMFPNLNKLINKNPGALAMLSTFMKGQGKAGEDRQGALIPGDGKAAPNVFSL